MTEQFTNNATTTLTTAALSTDTSIAIASATPFPASPNFRIMIDSEIMLVTAIVGSTFTVTRGAEGTLAAAHNNGANVEHILTAGAISQFRTDVLSVSLHTTTTSNFTQPSIGSTVSVSVTDSSGIYTNQFIYIDNGGYYTVSSITSPTAIVVTNVGDSGNVVFSTTVNSGSIVRDVGRPRILASANITTSQTTASTTYTDLATVGPTITMVTGASVIVTISSTLNQTAAGNTGYASVAVSGATTIAASDTNAAQYASAGNGFASSVSLTILITGLNPGTNIFTMKYRVDGSTWTFQKRSVTVTTL